MDLADIVRRVGRFKKEAHSILGKYETSSSRVIDLTRTHQQLNGLSIKQDDLFRQALRCVEQELYRAAHVMAWAAFMDFLEEKIASKGFSALHKHYSKWPVFTSLENLRESVPEFQLIDTLGKLGICSKTPIKALHGLLNKRNECAHPSDFYPELNETLGYISELFKRIAQLQPR